MTTFGRPPEAARPRDLGLVLVATFGLAACLTLIWLGMRAVMDIGGACADGGPYVSAQSCPDGATPALLLGVFGGFGFGAMGAAYGARVGGYAWIPLLGWTALFASLGWNFLDYGLFNPPEGEGVIWGWLIPGVMFQVMAWVPVWFGIVAWREARRAGSERPMDAFARPMRGPGQRTAPTGTTHEPAFNRPPVVPPSHRVEVVGPVRRGELQEIDALMGALITDAAADAPVDPDRRGAGELAPPAPADAPAPAVVPATVGADGADGTDGSDAFPEGTQALLDRLERLADMRDRGLLTPDEYETAKETVMHELEARS